MNNKDNNKDLIILSDNKNQLKHSPRDSNSITENNELNHQNTNNKINDLSADNIKIKNNEGNYAHSNNILSNDKPNSCIYKYKKCLLIIRLISFAVIIANVLFLLLH